MGKGALTRLRIIEDAAAVMNRKGWLATPVSDVLAATKLTKGGFYNHFGSLHALAGEAFDLAAGRLAAVVLDRLAGAGTARDRLARLLAAFSLVGTRRPPFDAGCPILNAATEADDAYEAMRRRVADAALGIVAAVEACIADGVRSGEFRTGLEPGRAAQFLFAAFEGGVMLAGVTRDPRRFAEVKDDLLLMVDGWAARPPGEGA